MWLSNGEINSGNTKFCYSHKIYLSFFMLGIAYT